MDNKYRKKKLGSGLVVRDLLLFSLKEEYYIKKLAS